MGGQGSEPPVERGRHRQMPSPALQAGRHCAGWAVRTVNSLCSTEAAPLPLPTHSAVHMAGPSGASGAGAGASGRLGEAEAEGPVAGAATQGE